MQKIKIENKQYLIADSIQNLRAEDSFISRKNKLMTFTGNGEKRKYIGSYDGENGRRLIEFFDYDNWGDVMKDGKRTYPIFSNNCFFSKSNLNQYLIDARTEYMLQEQVYKNDIAQYYNVHLNSVEQISEEKIFFSIYDVSDKKETNSSRAYIRSDYNIWDLWRSILLPKISYLSILKLIEDTDENSLPLFYFRVFIDYQFRSIVHPKLDIEIEKEQKEDTESSNTNKGREGQQKYRKKVIEHMPQCPFTKISDERILIASHIKPYKACIVENNLEDAYDFYNGLALSPTYDKLFDQGFITFRNNGELVCGTQLSRYTWEKLKINPNAKNVMRIFPERREKYLEYHRQYVFQDNIDDFD